LLLICAAAQAAPQILAFDKADIQLMPDGGPASSGPVVLPHQWDKALPGRAGSAIYLMHLPPVPPDAPLHGLYFPRVGNQVEIRVGGELLEQRGTLGTASVDAAKSPLWVPVRAGLLSSQRSTPLEVRVAVQPGRWGGLATPFFGPQAQLYPIYSVRYVWRQWGAVAVVFSIALMGIVAGGLWWMQREAIYGYFALGAPFGVLRFADRLWEQPPLGWPLWGGVMALCLAVFLLLLTHFSLAVIDRDSARVRQVFRVLIVVEAALAITAFMAGLPWLWTLALALLFPPACWAYALAAHQAWWLRRREAIALCLASLIPIGAGLRDFLVVRLAADGAGRYSLLPIATMLFVLLMGWLIMDRYARQAREYRGLLTSLDEKVRQREQELQASYTLLQHEHAQRAALVERQRIMRDIHDGVGAQLVGLLSLIRKGGRTNRAQLQEHANAALDELRMAVDSMQPVNGDLATVLATLRYRLQPRLVAMGIEVDWQVEELPTMADLTPQMVLQIQRILLEAFTNVLRHAQASRVRVSARQEGQPAQHLLLEIKDNGVGMSDRAPAGGHGLANMRARAQAIGATLELSSSPGEGTRVQIALPVRAPDSPG